MCIRDRWHSMRRALYRLDIITEAWEALRRARNWLHELLRQSDAMDEIHKPWIVTEGLESTSSFEIRKLRVALLVSLFHPDESLIQVTQGSIENCDRTRRHESSLV